MESSFKLTKMETDKVGRVRFLKYSIYHRGETYTRPDEEPWKSTVDQELEIRCERGGHWSAFMSFKGNDSNSTPQDALGRLSNWMKRMSEALEELALDSELGLKNPLENDPYRYTLEGLNILLKTQDCPFKEIENQQS